MSEAAPSSLHRRLLWLTLGGTALALVLSGVALTALFRDHVVNQFQAALARQLDQLVVELDFEQGQPVMDSGVVLDPRLMKPYSGWYWQIDVSGPGQTFQRAALRSRSLWDAELVLPPDDAGRPGETQVSQIIGPTQKSLLVLQRSVRSPDWPDRSYRLIVAGDLHLNQEATRRFAGLLALTFAGLLGLLGLAAWAQVRIGLRPLGEVQQALKAVREGQRERIDGRFPLEIAPLVADFNQVLGSNAEVVQRARALAGNLAHALKTPLTVLENEAARAERGDDAVAVPLLREQLALLRSQIDWHLTRARIAAAHGLPGRHAQPEAVIAGLLRVLGRAFEARRLAFHPPAASAGLLFAGEEQDLQEMLGNLLENACKWATANVWITVEAGATPAQLCVRIEDDGPGIAPALLDRVRQRGVRLDEQTPGTGLGLAIVQELVQLYGGSLDLQARRAGPGLAASLHLPRLAQP